MKIRVQKQRRYKNSVGTKVGVAVGVQKQRRYKVGLNEIESKRIFIIYEYQEDRILQRVYRACTPVQLAGVI